MATMSGRKDTENEQKEGAQKSGTEGKEAGSARPSGPNASENWTGNEEKLYSGSGAASSAKSSLRSVAGRGANAAEEAWDTAKQGLTQNLGEVVDRARGIKEDVMERARGMASDLSERASGAAETVTTAVKKNPMQSLLIGFGIGCLVGVFVSSAVRR